VATPSHAQGVASRARQALAKSRPLTRAMASQADAATVASALGQNVSTVQQLRRQQVCPKYIAHVVRRSVPQWFGDAEQLRAARGELKSLPAAELATDGLAEQLATIEERIAALDALSERVTADEVDEIKQYALPKGEHLERLLDLQQIDRVNAPIMLPSKGDTDTQGTLFEIKIQPAPLRDGSAAPALYLHLHTQALAAPDALVSLSQNEFAKVHVKTEEQKHIGAKWEQMQRSLGRDDKVHRGNVGTGVVDRLMRMAA
jgi:hypothetical protein